MRYKYQLDNLNCANCAGKIEAKIAETDGFEDVSSTTDNGKGFGSDDGYMDVLDIFNGKK